MSTDAEYEKQLMKQRANARARGVAPTTHTSVVAPIRCLKKDIPGAPLSFRDPSITLKYKPRLIVAPKVRVGKDEAALDELRAHSITKLTFYLSSSVVASLFPQVADQDSELYTHHREAF